MKGMKDEWGEKFFNGICPYTDKPCDKWLCYDCKLEKEERHLHDEEDENRGQGMTLTEFMDERYQNREDKDNMYGVGVSDSEFRKFIIDYLLGEDWHIVDPLGQTQINEIALYEILEKHSKRYKKECRGRKRSGIICICQKMNCRKYAIRKK